MEILFLIISLMVTSFNFHYTKNRKHEYVKYLILKFAETNSTFIFLRNLCIRNIFYQNYFYEVIKILNIAIKRERRKYPIT